MPGTGYHPEGHVWVEYRGSMRGYRWQCSLCWEIAKDQHQNTECVDDF